MLNDIKFVMYTAKNATSVTKVVLTEHGILEAPESRDVDPAAVAKLEDSILVVRYDTGEVTSSYHIENCSFVREEDNTLSHLSNNEMLLAVIHDITRQRQLYRHLVKFGTAGENQSWTTLYPDLTA